MQHRPMPEAIDGGAWDVTGSPQQRHAGVTAQATGGRMLVPLHDTAGAEAIRRHELAHVRITPRDRMAASALHPTILNHCEDARVSQYLEDEVRMSTQPGADLVTDDEIRDIAGGPLALVASAAAALHRSTVPRRLMDAANDAGRPGAALAAQYGQRLAVASLDGHRMSVDTFALAEALARTILDMYGDPDDLEDGAGDEDGDGDGRFDPLRGMLPDYGEPAGEPDWYPMTVTTQPLTRTLPATMRGRARLRPDLRGRRLRHVGRLHTDGRVFASRPPTKGAGAVLIDTSGSMSLTVDEIDALTALFPAGVIGCYSSTADEGHLWIVARRGRITTPDRLDPPGGGNGCDGPALAWLNQQPGPRYWVCDGHVTERGDRSTARARAQCARLAREGAVVRVERSGDITEAEAAR